MVGTALTWGSAWGFVGAAIHLVFAAVGWPVFIASVTLGSLSGAAMTSIARRGELEPSRVPAGALHERGI